MRENWPEYLMEAALLALFMISACCFALLLEHPASPLRQAIPNGALRRIPMGLAMGLTAVLLIRSPLGQRSGAHMNPSTTLTFWRLGKMAAPDMAGYIAAQFAGAVAGVSLMSYLTTGAIAHPSISYVATLPGTPGLTAAFAAEAAMSFILMTAVLHTSNHPHLSRYTPFLAGTLVALYISIEAPISGMSMNPARSFGSAFSSRIWTALWIYFLAPPLGMLAAAELYIRTRGLHRVLCAKFDHHNHQRCIFRCRFGEIE